MSVLRCGSQQKDFLGNFKLPLMILICFTGNHGENLLIFAVYFWFKIKFLKMFKKKSRGVLGRIAGTFLFFFCRIFWDIKKSQIPYKNFGNFYPNWNLEKKMEHRNYKWKHGTKNYKWNYQKICRTFFWRNLRT